MTHVEVKDFFTFFSGCGRTYINAIFPHDYLVSIKLSTRKATGAVLLMMKQVRLEPVSSNCPQKHLFNRWTPEPEAAGDPAALTRLIFRPGI